MNIASKEELNLIIDKLSLYRKEGKIKQYKTLTDTFDLMTKHLDNTTLMKGSESTQYFASLCPSLQKEIKELINIKLELLTNNKIREHREYSISYVNINRILKRIRYATN